MLPSGPCLDVTPRHKGLQSPSQPPQHPRQRQPAGKSSTPISGARGAQSPGRNCLQGFGARIPAGGSFWGQPGQEGEEPGRVWEQGSGLHAPGGPPSPLFDNTGAAGKGPGGRGGHPGAGAHPPSSGWATPFPLKDGERKAEFPRGRRNVPADVGQRGLFPVASWPGGSPILEGGSRV